jgi:predicted enzyme related to lactoylglutathione lyase
MNAPRVTALGWYVVFGHASQMAAMHDHYTRSLGLPCCLHWRRADGHSEDKDYVWLGEATLLDINYDGVLPPLGPADADPATARQVPIMRVHAIEALVAALGDRATAVTPCDTGRQAFVVDPMGTLIGLREVPAQSPLAADREAARRDARGEAFNPGCAAMPRGWQELGWVRIRAADPDRLTAFYATVIGLPVIDHSGAATRLDLGDNVVLEITGGGYFRPPPAEQMAARSAMILRTADISTWLARMARHRVALVGPRYSAAKGDWFYCADPEGNVIGLAERHHPSAYCRDLPVAPEDIEAARRAAEAAAVKNAP